MQNVGVSREFFFFHDSINKELLATWREHSMKKYRGKTKKKPRRLYFHSINKPILFLLNKKRSFDLCCILTTVIHVRKSAIATDDIVRISLKQGGGCWVPKSIGSVFPHSMIQFRPLGTIQYNNFNKL